jgi:nucleoside-diphosphate-sugar epimerase
MWVNMKKVLVTGASGFIGRVLCAELLERKFAVRGVIRGSSNWDGGDGEVVKVEGMDDATEWTDAMEGVDIIIHLAARVHVMSDTVVDSLAEFRRVNTAGTEHLARCAAANGVKRLVYASSIKVNGEETRGDKRFTEADASAPQDPYGVSKWEAEQALHRVAGETGLEVVIVRPPLVYGPGVRGNFINLLTAIDKGVPLPLAGANNVRSLIYVNNLVDALIVCATHPAAAGQTYLVSDGTDISMAVLIKEIAHSLERNNRSFYLPPALLRAFASLSGRSDQIERLLNSLRVDDKKIRDELGWIPPYTLKQGLRATADWFRN